MIILEKSVNSIESAHIAFNTAIGSTTKIIDSMQEFLHYKHNAIINVYNDYINHDIVLCETSTTNSINTEDKFIDKVCSNGECSGSITNMKKPSESILDNMNQSTSASDIILPYTSSDSVKINRVFSSYEEFVEWALWICSNNIPSPFKLGYPSSCHCLTLATDYFTIRFPNNIGIGIKVFSNKKGIQYSLNIVFYNIPGSSEVFIRETNEYKNAIKNGWTEKKNEISTRKVNI